MLLLCSWCGKELDIPDWLANRCLDSEGHLKPTVLFFCADCRIWDDHAEPRTQWTQEDEDYFWKPLM